MDKKLLLDTNFLILSFYSQRKAARLLNSWIEDGVVLYISVVSLSEFLPS